MVGNTSGRVMASLRLEINGEVSVLEVVKQVVFKATAYIVYVDGGHLPNGDEFHRFEDLDEALADFAEQAKLFVETIEEAL